MPALKQIGITVDCPDADQLAEFWERCLGYARRPGAPGGPYVTLERVDGSPDGPPVVTFQSVPEPKTSKARIHLDLPLFFGRGVLNWEHRARLHAVPL